MKQLLVLSCIILLVSCKKETENSDQDIAANLKQYTIEQFMDNESVFGGSFSPDN